MKKISLFYNVIISINAYSMCQTQCYFYIEILNYSIFSVLLTKKNKKILNLIKFTND
jgi:hypothetical protein